MIHERHSQHIVFKCLAIGVFFFFIKISELFLFSIQHIKFSVTDMRVLSGVYNTRVNLQNFKLLVKNITITCAAFTLAFLRHLNVPTTYVCDHF